MCFKRRKLEGVKVLLVDAELQLLKILKQGLEELGAKVCTTSSPEKGVKHALHEKWHVCVIGHALPQIHAATLVEEIHAVQQMPFIITADGDISLMTNIPIDSFLMKPFELNKLVSVVQEACK
jgi:two-component system KDP operon response regulator KdpE